MSELPRPRAHIMELRPYVQGRSTLAGIADPVKLSSNESSWGPSPRARAAYRQTEELLHRYPDGAQEDLREALAQTYGLEKEGIICGNGSEELIGLLIRAYAGDGDEIVLSENHFMMCPIYGRTQGARIVLAAESAHTVDVDALLDCVTTATRMVIVANPNNPTGTYIPGSEIRRLHRALPSHVMLLLDGAYSEYVVAEDYEDGSALVRAQGNVVMTRTFSKIHGLAGLRIGWAYAPAHVIDALQRIRTPFNANRAALAAAAAATRDVEFVANVRRKNALAQQYIREQLAALGLPIIPSVTNFYLIDFDGVAGKSAREASAFLESRGVIPRPIKSGRGENTLRITIGREHENDAALVALRDYLGGR